MNKLLIPLAASLLLSTPLAFAVSTTELKVKGTIVPSACTPTLNGANEGVIDHGKVSFSDLNENDIKTIGNHTLTLNVTCGAAILFALQTVDNRLGSAIYPSDYGLGMINVDQKLGGYSLLLRNPIADSVQVQIIESPNKTGPWNPGKFMDPLQYMSIASMADSTQPLPTEVLNVELLVSTFINPTKNLDLNGEVDINGSATIEVIYL